MIVTAEERASTSCRSWVTDDMHLLRVQSFHVRIEHADI